jgi:hypothetical protein
MEFNIGELQGYGYIKAIFDYNTDKVLINEIIDKTTRMCNKVNPHGPDGKLRQQDVRFNKILGGLLAEVSLMKFLEKTANEHNIPFEIIESTFNQEEDLSKLGFNQIDARISVNGEIKELEIRSSYSYKTTFERLIGVPLYDGKGAFSIIGWYTSSNKPQEVKKQYYIFAIHLYLPSETQNRIYEKVEVFLAGAASKQTLEDKGVYTSLKQEGAKFRVINPLNSVPDPINVINDILGVNRL